MAAAVATTTPPMRPLTLGDMTTWTGRALDVPLPLQATVGIDLVVPAELPQPPLPPPPPPAVNYWPPPPWWPGWWPAWQQWQRWRPEFAAELLSNAMFEESRKMVNTAMNTGIEQGRLSARLEALEAREMELRARVLRARRRSFEGRAFLLWLEDVPDRQSVLLRACHEATGSCGHLELADADLNSAFRRFARSHRDGLLVELGIVGSQGAAGSSARVELLVGDFLDSILDTAFFEINSLGDEWSIRLPGLGPPTRADELGEGLGPSICIAPTAGAAPMTWQPQCDDRDIDFSKCGAGPLPPRPLGQRSVGGAATLRGHVLASRLQNLLTAGTAGQLPPPPPWPWRHLAKRLVAALDGPCGASRSGSTGSHAAQPSRRRSSGKRDGPRSSGDSRCSSVDHRRPWTPTGHPAATFGDPSRVGVAAAHAQPTAPLQPRPPQQHRSQRPRPSSAGCMSSASAASARGKRYCHAGGSTASTGVSPGASPFVSIATGASLSDVGDEQEEVERWAVHQELEAAPRTVEAGAGVPRGVIRHGTHCAGLPPGRILGPPVLC